MADPAADIARRDRAAAILANIEARFQRPPGKKEVAEAEGRRPPPADSPWADLLPDYDEPPRRKPTQAEQDDWNQLLDRHRN